MDQCSKWMYCLKKMGKIKSLEKLFVWDIQWWMSCQYSNRMEKIPPDLLNWKSWCWETGQLSSWRENFTSKSLCWGTLEKRLELFILQIIWQVGNFTSLVSDETPMVNNYLRFSVWSQSQKCRFSQIVTFKTTYWVSLRFFL